ncbi:unnamed protein product [Ranitomeya imitator]|uniref:RRM domain-containing protein n=1 Tax=Ranitomeya imitator TaxID=111125 RepID=A0ABN9LED3_9NEOB|nr:unnamed protein product [Ranitomeya imitator]
MAAAMRVSPELRWIPAGLSIAEEGITFVFDQRGRKSGEAFVHFVSDEHAEQALLRHKQEIGSRYIEIFPSRKNEIQNARFLIRKRKGVTFAPTMKELYDPDMSINNENKDRPCDLVSENNHMNDYMGRTCLRRQRIPVNSQLYHQSMISTFEDSLSMRLGKILQMDYITFEVTLKDLCDSKCPKVTPF